MMKVFFGGALVLVGLAIGGIIFVVSGVYDIGADTPHWPLTRDVLQLTRERSIAARAASLNVPDLSDEQMILKGAGQYAAMCANCHPAPGRPKAELGQGLYPRPPDLSQAALDPRVTFWVVKHGLKMTGMPAWGPDHDDQALWNIVAFVQKLPEMSAQRYQDLVAKAPPDEEMQSMGRKSDKMPPHGMDAAEKASAPANRTGRKADAPR